MAAKQTTLVSPLKRLLEKGKVKKKKKVPQHPGQGTTILSILLLVVKPNPNKEQDWNEMAKEDDGKSNILFFFSFSKQSKKKTHHPSTCSRAHGLRAMKGE